MKYSNIVLTTIMMFTVFAMAGCDSSSEKMDDAESSVIEANRDLEIAANEVVEEVRVYRLENAERFRGFNRTTSDIERQIENEPDQEVKDRLESKLEELEETQRELNRELDNFQVSESNNWDEFKDNFSSRMDDLGDSLNDFFAAANTTN